MTRKHFEAIAAIVKLHNVEGSRQVPMALSMANHMADYFAKENPNFDVKRFLTACGF